jgi:uncharacterized RDD family membrane protein YckC
VDSPPPATPPSPEPPAPPPAPTPPTTPASPAGQKSGTGAPLWPAPGTGPVDTPSAPGADPWAAPQYQNPPSFPGAPPRATDRPGRPPLPAAVRLAPLGTRLLARLVDIAAVFGLNVLVNGWFFIQYYQAVSPVIRGYVEAVLAGRTPPDLAFSERAMNLNLVMSLISLALWFAYEVPATANTGQTLGKRLFKIRVARLDAKQLTFGLSLRRWFVLGFPSLLLGSCGLPLQIVDCLWCTWDRPARQCLHDKLVQTVVVQALPPVPPGPGSDAGHGQQPVDRTDTDARID